MRRRRIVRTIRYINETFDVYQQRFSSWPRSQLTGVSDSVNMELRIFLLEDISSAIDQTVRRINNDIDKLIAFSRGPLQELSREVETINRMIDDIFRELYESIDGNIWLNGGLTREFITEEIPNLLKIIDGRSQLAALEELMNLITERSGYTKYINVSDIERLRDLVANRVLTTDLIKRISSRDV